MRKLKLLLTLLALLVGGGVTYAETDYTSLMSSTWTNSSGDFGGGKERYQAANYEAGKIMYQSFTAPAAGIYEIKFYAVASSTSGRGFDNIYGDNIAQAYASAGSNKSTVAMTVINQTGCTLVESANIRTLSVEAAAGETIEYGLENIATGGNWYTIKELSAKMKTVAELFQDQYDEALAVYNNSTESVAGAKTTFLTYVDALNTAMSGTLAAAQTASDNLASALATYESQSYPVKGSGVKYDFSDKMSTSIDSWTCKQGNGPAQYGFTGATETYGATVAGEVMYNTITGLTNGEYEIHFYAVANAANSGGTSGSNLTYVYANDQTLNIDVIEQSACTPSDYERTFTVMVTDGTIKYGITNTAAAGNWNICKNVALYMTGAPDLNDYYDAIATKLTTANSIKTEKMNAKVLTDLQAAIDATEGYNSITIIGTLETLSNDLTTAINAANTSIENYTAVSTILNAASTLDAAGQASYTANETISTLQSAYNNATLEAMTSEQETACKEALRTAAKSQTTENSDWTAALVNPSFESDFTDGWTNNGMARQNNTSFAKTGTYYAEKWEPNGTFSVKQTVSNIPAGIYSISAKALARSATSAKLFAADSEKAITIEENAGDYTVEFLQEADGNLTFGFEGVGDGTGSSWLCVDNFTMKFVRAATANDYKVTLNNVITTATATRNTNNEGEGAFQIPTSAGTTLASAITTAQGVYNNGSATISDVTEAITTLNNAIEAYKGITLNAPADGKKFNIVLTYSGWEYDQKAVTYIANDRADMGNYNVKYLAAANANLAQAFTFTKVSGNNYKLSQTDVDGNTRYLSTGTAYEGGNSSQIRTTTNVDDAMQVTVIPTATEGVWNLKNVEADEYIGSQDAGVYTVNSHITFNIIEASQASVSVNIDNAVKYATRIFPFTPTLPSGVTAYSCAAVDESVLTLAEVATPEANKPYILYAESGYTGDALTGWGIAGATTATVGLLTGVYTETAAPVGSYVLQNNDSKVGFYKVAESKQPTVGANRCYLEIANATAREAFYFGEQTTGIEAVKALTSGEATIYDAAGRQVNGLQKGINIVKRADGKSFKVMVK